ncbi:MAG: T9SS type A sorting domain-containing protein [Bacteroidota bacterium]|nr:T9SS type A sorting domain-containing protein [Bacteroidota bacterium]
MPIFTVPPVLEGRVGTSYFDDPHVTNVNGDSIAFKLVPVKAALNYASESYIFPNQLDVEASANENGTGPAIFEIDSKTGNLTWDAPVEPGLYAIAYIAESWVKVGNKKQLAGFTMRNFILNVFPIQNNRPMLSIPKDTVIQAGTVLDLTVEASDLDGDPLEILTSGAPYDLAVGPATFETNENLVDFNWSTSEEHIRSQPYEIIFTVRDDPKTGPVLYDYKVWRITVSTLASTANEIDKSHLKVYPNPSTGIVKFTSNYMPGKVQVIIYDLSGKIIYNENSLSISTLKIDLNAQPNGNYFIILKGEKVIETKRLILIK